MEDLNVELCKLDPSRLIWHIHYLDEFVPGEDIVLEVWDSARIIDEAAAPARLNAFREDTGVDTVIVEVVCPGITYWVFVPVKFPNLPGPERCRLQLVTDLGVSACGLYLLKGTVLPFNSELVPDMIVPVMGDFYIKLFE